MELGIAESSVTIKTLSVNGKRMPKGIYSQLPQRSLLADSDCEVVGRPWGRVVDPKCCHDARRKPHRHVLFEHEGELFVWVVFKKRDDAPWHLQDRGYQPRSKAGTAFVDACLLETHLGAADFFQGKVFSLVPEGELVTRIEDVKVYLTGSNEANRLRSARERWPGHPSLEEAEKELRTLYEKRGKGAREWYPELVADVKQVKQARTNYVAALEMVAGLPQLFLGA
ncbi:hypothetical protein [Streptomyces albidoflavus]|uniref:hypothetical protein n=1 Tax=Streptomyces albidoflavus TaxID=1886 RepID=UPI0004C9B2E6|nr:hypothetical protein [Streptomyces albidoflavus]